MSGGRRTLWLAALAGATGGACWLPFGLAPLLPVALLVAMRGLRSAATTRDAVGFGIVYGAARYAVAAHFLLALLAHSPLAIAIYLLAIAFILPYALLEAWGAFFLERRFGLPRSIGFGALFVFGGWLRTLGDLSFPADRLAHAFGTNPAWLSPSPWIGATGIEAMVLGVAVCLDRAIEARAAPGRASTWGILALGLWLAPLAIDVASAPARAAEGGLRVAVVQPAVTLEDKMRRERHPEIWKRLEELSADAANDAGLVVWPETARPLPVVWDGSGPFRDPEMESLAARLGVPILYGCEIARKDGGSLTALYNGAAIAYPDGRPGAWYGKQRLLPFVEGVPFARALGWDPNERAAAGRRSFLTLMGHFTPGPEPPLFDVAGTRLGVLICYEGMYDSLAARYRASGADALVVLTNDAWWGRSVFPLWHAKMVASRARETRLPVIRGANNGISSVTDSRGRMQASTELDSITVLTATVPVTRGTGEPSPR